MDSLMHARLLIGSDAEGKTWKEIKRDIENKFGFSPFINEQLLILALTHFSYGLASLTKEFKALARHGDKVIYYYLSRKLLPVDFSDMGQALKATRLLSSNRILDECGRRMGLDQYLLHHGTVLREVPKKKHLADAFEALVGAIDVEHGVDEVTTFLDTWLWSQKSSFESESDLQSALSKPQPAPPTPEQNRWDVLRRFCAKANLPEPRSRVLKISSTEELRVTVHAGRLTRSAQSRDESRAMKLAVRALIKAVRAVL